MDLAQMTQYRRLAGKVGLVAGVLLVVALLDGVVARHRTEVNVVEALPGETTELTGPLVEKVQSLQELIYEASSPHLTLTFEMTFAGYWFGGEMWRGWLRLDPDTPPGKYTLRVKPREPQTKEPPLLFRINVYADEQARQRQAKSLLLRYGGISPWLLAEMAFPVLALSGLAIFLLSSRIDQLMAQGGRAEVYRVTRRENGLEIGFGLGTRHGLKPGDHLTLCDTTGHPLGQVEVLEVSDTDAVARTDLGAGVQAGFLVIKSR